MSHNYYNFRILLAGKFGGLAVYNITITKLKSAKISYLHNIIRMAILYRTAKFNIIILLCCNILAIAILGSTVKFNSRQYFQLYNIINLL